ncbi:TetR/AcrR family transcriptional regulator [Photobacterium sp. CCB-ST2H9]|uniref:TetR/AcrR family transcriptional regulator n=1 Tax=Photobacterium sp. CCB-ST2H9 TaxID=2912855 RepID=UPI00200461B3|nr:TetR/AcrR family transcriptional regulator [Photobacterium sp. CCB-ST2H9]UTM59046.1 TetR/AcrR family transcriptional regulator [Photobacterium sp. CCB-ST2H9]
MFGFNCNKDRCALFSGERVPKTKKQQAIADRDQELIMLAKDLVNKEGFANLTMDKLAAISPYSKGTVYNHFCSKEDVIVALCTHAIKAEMLLFNRVLGMEGSSREILMAVHVAYHIFARLEPVLSTCLLTAKTPWVIDKASGARVEILNQLEEQMIDSADAIVNHALEEGNLMMSAAVSTDAVVFANWSLALGSNALIMNATNSRCIHRLQDPFTVLNNVNMLLDGMDWKPLSSEKDYKRLWKHIEQTFFADEISLLSQLGR